METYGGDLIIKDTLSDLIVNANSNDNSMWLNMNGKYIVSSVDKVDVPFNDVRAALRSR